jgi:hypothetical protein
MYRGYRWKDGDGLIIHQLRQAGFYQAVQLVWQVPLLAMNVVKNIGIRRLIWYDFRIDTRGFFKI